MGDLFLAWWPVISVVGGSAFGGLALWVAWTAKQQFVTHDAWDEWRRAHLKDHQALDATLASGAREFATIKTELEQLPSRDDLAALDGKLSGLTADVAALSEGVDGVKTAINGLSETIQTLMQHELAEAREAKAAAARRGG
jgi:chromosome segregation ATPase